MRIKTNVIYRICVVLLILVTWLFVWGWRSLPDLESLPLLSEPGPTTIGSQYPQLTSIPKGVWDTITADKDKPVTKQQGRLFSQFRLAGTFFSFNDEDETQRIAIIDDLKTNKQRLLSEQEMILDYKISSIERDRVILVKGDETTALTLQFALQNSPNESSHTREENPNLSGDVILSQNRFGKQVSENRWILKREALMGYYNELLDNPERIAKIYISLAPDYNDQQKIEGYNLNMVGEEDFFGAVGLKEGDVIRKVNSMRMTSQTRGEYFLKEFVNERLNAVVIDIERESVPKKMIYLLR